MKEPEYVLFKICRRKDMPMGYSKTDSESGVRYYLDKALHREERFGPAAILYDGTRFWENKGNMHREGGPSMHRIELGSERWIRPDGVEIEVSDEKWYYLKGIELTGIYLELI